LTTLPSAWSTITAFGVGQHRPAFDRLGPYRTQAQDRKWTLPLLQPYSDTSSLRMNVWCSQAENLVDALVKADERS
jgi:hypothetical protein